MYRAIRGTSDILPDEQAYWRYVEAKAADAARFYGYRRLDTPTFEDSGLFTRSVGQGTDIVEKEMYTFTDKGDKVITLRPEGTAPVCRSYLEHGMSNLPQPVKLFYLANIFRYERPQAGRLREHHQFGCEAIGDGDPAIDAEVIAMAWHFFQSLNLQNFTLQLNSIGCRQCRPGYLATLKEYYQSSASAEICNDCKDRLNRNTLRLLDCKQPSCQHLADNAPQSANHLCADCAEHFDKLKSYLALINIPFSINHRLVRGLDYYTRTVFEIQPEDGGGQSTLGGGGRYDDLIEELGGKPTPAIGFASGIERIILNLKKQGVEVPALPALQIFIAYMGEEARNTAITLADRLRHEGIGAVTATGSKSLKAQMRQADSFGARYTAIIGEDEVKTTTLTIRDMASARQTSIPIDDVCKYLVT